jgi:hypothetical protein
VFYAKICWFLVVVFTLAYVAEEEKEDEINEQIIHSYLCEYLWENDGINI